MPAEPPVEFAVVQTVDHAIAVEVEPPQVTGLAGLRLERGAEQFAILLVHDTVAVGVAEQSEESIDAVSARHANASAVERLPEAVVDETAVDGQSVMAVGQ